MKNLKGLALALMIVAQGCKSKDDNFDASGVFESTEVIVSSETSGKILNFAIQEGDNLSAGQEVGNVDCENLRLQKSQIIASEDALKDKQSSAAPQIQIYKEQLTTQQKQLAVLTQQLKVLQVDQKRLQRLVAAEAAPSKQLDDINGQIDILNKQIDVNQGQQTVTNQQIKSQEELVAIANRAIMSEKKPLQERVAQAENLIGKCKIINPINGTVLVKYAEKDEITAPGKALYKVSNLNEMILRAYVTGQQLANIKINQKVKVNSDSGEFPGVISWISNKAEFTPKTIQTKDERQNLVYAIKVKVANDGKIKIGMYGGVTW